MASIIKRGNHQYQVQIRRKGFPTQRRTVETQTAATNWANTVYRDSRRDAVSANTIRLVLALISHIFSSAKAEWGRPVDNPVASGIG